MTVFAFIYTYIIIYAFACRFSFEPVVTSYLFPHLLLMSSAKSLTSVHAMILPKIVLYQI